MRGQDMKAAVFDQYGSAQVIHLVDLSKPTPRRDEVLIEVVTTTVNAADWRLRSLKVPRGFGPLVRIFMGLTRPRKRILGVELAGRVVAIGSGVSRFAVGDDVIAFPGARLGAHAEFVALPELVPMIPKPIALNWDEAAALCFGGTTAIDFLINKGGLQAGEHVLINGASGSVGTAAVQLARSLGAVVSAVCGASQSALVERLGADQTIDYAAEDFTRLGQTWDVILDVVGNAPWQRVRQVLNPHGRLLSVVANLPETLKAVFPRWDNGKRNISGTAREDVRDLNKLAELVVSNNYRPVIDEVFSFDQIADAHRRFDTGSKHGSLVIHVHTDASAPLEI
ncbi:MAG: NAD(P)-dependent alcohol dehydrogenase [Burkholderiaceae bacterium]